MPADGKLSFLIREGHRKELQLSYPPSLINDHLYPSYQIEIQNVCYKLIFEL